MIASPINWVEKMHLYGTHTGARIAVCMALHEGGRIDRLILMGSAFTLQNP